MADLPKLPNWTLPIAGVSAVAQASRAAFGAKGSPPYRESLTPRMAKPPDGPGNGNAHQGRFRPGGREDVLMRRRFRRRWARTHAYPGSILLPARDKLGAMRQPQGSPGGCLSCTCGGRPCQGQSAGSSRSSPSRSLRVDDSRRDHRRSSRPDSWATHVSVE